MKRTIQTSTLQRSALAASLALTMGAGNTWARPLGVDVSNNNGSVNWSTIKSGGISFAWAKATEGVTYTDSYYSGNISNGKAAGVVMGAYDFSHPESDSPGSEANYFWGVVYNTILADGKSLMPTLDFETFSGHVGASSYSDWANQWSSSVKSKAAANGVVITPIIYTSTGEACNFDTSVAQWGAWIAQPDNGNPQTGNPWEDGGCEEWGSGAWDVWQYHWPASAGGALANMDRDVFDGSALTPVIATSTSPKIGVDDFDKDGHPDAVYVSTNNYTWNVRFSKDGSGHSFAFGTGGDIPMLAGSGQWSADFDGDGIADAVIVRPSNGTWYVRFSSTGVTHSFQFGHPGAGDIPLLGGDFDGDGVPDAVVYRPSDLSWNVRLSGDQTTRAFTWGVANAIPLMGDFDGDGAPDAVYVDPSNYTWHIRFSSDASAHSFAFGTGGDIPMLGGDFDGDGVPDAVVFRPSNSTWYVRLSGDGTTRSFAFGTTGDKPMLGGDFDGDGHPDAILYRASTQSWYVRLSGDGTTRAFVWGSSTALPVH